MDTYDPESFMASKIRNGNSLKRVLEKIEKNINITFPIFSHSQEQTLSTRQELSESLGYLALNYDIDALISYKIVGNRLVLNLPQLTFPHSYYRDFELFSESYAASLYDYVVQYSEISGRAVEEKVLKKDIHDVLMLEKSIADVINEDNKNDGKKDTSGLSQADQKEMITVYELNDLQIFINFTSYLQAINPDNTVNNLSSAASSNIQISITNKAKLLKLQKFFKTTKVNYRVVYSMIHFKILKSFKNLFPKKPMTSIADDWVLNGNQLDAENKFGIVPKKLDYEPHPSDIQDKDEAEEMCAIRMRRLYKYAAERIFIDEVLPTKEDKKEFRHRLNIITVKLLKGFKVRFLQ